MKHFIAFALVVAPFFSLLSTPVHSQNDPAKLQARAEEIKVKIKSLGLGERSVVSLKLYDGRKFKGYVREAAEDDFTVVDRNANANTMRYSDVSSVAGRNMSTGAKIAIGVGIGAGATLLVLYLVFQHITRNN